MSLQQTSRVLIVGSGPSGLIAALVLLKNGISVRIIEKEREHHVALRGAGIQPRTLELEHFMGVDEVLNAGKPGNLILNLIDPSDPRRVASQQRFFETIEPTPAVPITCAIMLGQFQHQAILRKHIESFGTSVELGTELVSFEDTTAGVQATLRKTSDASSSDETSVFDYIIGADGARSIVRKSLGVEFVGRLEDDMSRYLVDAFVDGHELPGVTMFGKPGAEVVSFIQSTVPNVYQIIICNALQNYDIFLPEANNTERIEQEIARISKRDDIHLTEIRTQGLWRANVRMASSFRKGCVFIVGDAAHTHPPTGGQGLNTSIQDSYNLAWKMALVLKGLGKPDILDSYAGERMPVVAHMLNLTTSLLKNEKYQSTHKDGDKPIRGRELFQLNVNYRWSDIVLDERFEDKADMDAYGIEGQAVRAGDRAPDAPSLECLFVKDGHNEVSRLFDLFVPTQHVALLFQNGSPETTKALLSPMSRVPENLLLKVLIIPAGAEHEPPASAEFDYIFRDTEGHAYEGYGIGSSSSTVIVRPDGHVGTFAVSAAGIEKYFSLIFN